MTDEYDLDSIEDDLLNGKVDLNETDVGNVPYEVCGPRYNRADFQYPPYKEFLHDTHDQVCGPHFHDLIDERCNDPEDDDTHMSTEDVAPIESKIELREIKTIASSELVSESTSVEMDGIESLSPEMKAPQVLSEKCDQDVANKHLSDCSKDDSMHCKVKINSDDSDKDSDCKDQNDTELETKLGAPKVMSEYAFHKQQCRKRKWSVLISAFDMLDAEEALFKHRKKKRIYYYTGLKSKPRKLPKRRQTVEVKTEKQDVPAKKPKTSSNTTRQISTPKGTIIEKEVEVIELLSSSEDENLSSAMVRKNLRFFKISIQSTPDTWSMNAWSFYLLRLSNAI